MPSICAVNDRFSALFGDERGRARPLTLTELLAVVPRATHTVLMPAWDTYRPGVGGGVHAYPVCEAHIDQTVAANPYPQDYPAEVSTCRDGSVHPTGGPCGSCYRDERLRLGL